MLRISRRPHWRLWPTVAAIVVFAVAFAAGQWQSGRAAEKDVIESRHAALRDAPAMALPARIADADREAFDGRRVATQGLFLNDKTIFLDNQVQNRMAGYHVLTPLHAQNGAVVLVNRGWVALGRTRSELPVIAPVTGSVMIEGSAALPPLRVYEIKPEAQQGRVWQNLQLAAMSKQLGVDLLPFVLRLSSDTGDGLARLASSAVGTSGINGTNGTGGTSGTSGASPGSRAGVTAAAGAAGTGTGTAGMTAAKHRGYAFQWYSLAALTALLFVIFTFFERSESHGPSS